MEDIPDENKIIISEKDLKKLEAYNKILNTGREYQKNNPEKLKVIQAKYYKKLREEHPEKYQILLERRRKSYAKKKEALKKQEEELNISLEINKISIS